MSLSKRRRYNTHNMVEAYWITEPEVLEVHPFSALINAATNGDLLEARYLVAQQDKDTFSSTPAGLPTMTPPLIHAAWRGNDRMADLLAQRGAKDAFDLATVLDVGFGGNPLHWAAAAGHDSMLERFLVRGGSSCANQRSYEGFTPLHAAASHGHTGCVRLLLSHQADPDIVDLNDSAPLHEAAQWGHAAAAKELLGSKAAPDGRNAGSETPLLLAARGGYTDIVQLLLEAGAALEGKNASGITPLLSAAFFGHEPTVRLLHSRGADRKAVDASRQRNSLEWAAFNNHREVVKLLLDQQRQLSRLLDIATEGDADDVLAYLRAL